MNQTYHHNRSTADNTQTCMVPPHLASTDKHCVTVLMLLCLITFAILSTTAQGALIDRGGGLLYDDVLDITWLMDANYQATELTAARVDEIVANNTLVFSDLHILSASDFVPNNEALMTWWGAMAWTDQLEYFDPVRGTIYDDWRLPTVSPIDTVFDTTFSNNGTTDFGYGFTGTESEMAHLFYTTLGNLGICEPNGSGSTSTCDTQASWGLTNSGPFINLNTQTYWSNTELGVEVWAFDFGVGFQGLKTESNRNNTLRAFAVRDGDVAAVPLPATIWLFASGLLGLWTTSRIRFKRW